MTEKPVGLLRMHLCSAIANLSVTNLIRKLERACNGLDTSFINDRSCMLPVSVIKDRRLVIKRVNASRIMQVSQLAILILKLTLRSADSLRMKRGRKE